MKIYVKGTVTIEVREDDYLEGEKEWVNGWTTPLSHSTFDSFKELLIDIEKSTGYMFESKEKLFSFDVENSILQSSALVNVDNEIADDTEIEEWKNGETTLYVADMFVKIEMIGEARNVTEKEIKSFGVVDLF